MISAPSIWSLHGQWHRRSFSAPDARRDYGRAPCVSAHQEFLHIRSFCTSGASAHQEFLHIRSFCTSGASAHQELLHIRSFCTSGASAHQEFLHLSRLACVCKLDVRQARPYGLAKPSLSASRFSLAKYLSSDSCALPLFLPAAAAAVVVPASASSSTSSSTAKTCALTFPDIEGARARLW
jgi:hypothetical protein